MGLGCLVCTRVPPRSGPDHQAGMHQAGDHKAAGWLHAKAYKTPHNVTHLHRHHLPREGPPLDCTWLLHSADLKHHGQPVADVHSCWIGSLTRLQVCRCAPEGSTGKQRVRAYLCLQGSQPAPLRKAPLAKPQPVQTPGAHHPGAALPRLAARWSACCGRQAARGCACHGA